MEVVVELKPGSRWKSAVCDAEVIVVKPGNGSAELGCGGAPMYPMDGEAPNDAELDPKLAGGTNLGKRYVDEGSGLEVLCTKAGAGTLTLYGTPLTLQGAKPLPASD
jgi:hypothetical protein